MSPQIPARIRWLPLLPGLSILAGFWVVAALVWATDADGSNLSTGFFFVYLGLATGVSQMVFVYTPKRSQRRVRLASLVLVGLPLLGFAGLLGRENFQLEWFFLYALSGLFMGATMHYAIAKIIGPLLMGRMWCGWGCWTAMILDLLPFRRSPGRLPGRWGWLRYAHFALSFGVVLVAWAFFGLGYERYSLTALLWLAGGNALYYVVAIGLAYALKDNRAFCKYVCPVTVPLKLTTRFALLKIGGNAARCTGCQACTRLCPMDIRVHEYIQAGQRVLSTECIACQNCVTACAHQAIELNFGLDLGGEEKWRLRTVSSSRFV